MPVLEAPPAPRRRITARQFREGIMNGDGDSRRKIVELVFERTTPAAELTLGVDRWKQLKPGLGKFIETKIKEGTTDTKDLAELIMQRVQYEKMRRH